MENQAKAGPKTPRRPARSWRRYWARVLDTLIFAFLLGLLLAILNPEVFRWIEQENELIGNLLVLAAIIPLEALCLSRFGTTPGKRLLGLRVVRADGSPMEYPQALSRGFSVWISGLGFGIPLVTLFTMAHAKGVLERQGRTSWDRSCNTQVVCALDTAGG